MKRVEHLEGRCHQHLAAASEAASQRELLLAAVSSQLDDEANDSRSAPLDVLESVNLQQLHKLQEQATTITRTLGSTALLAERASKKVKRLDFLLDRVTQTREIAVALQQQRANIDKISGAIEQGDLAAATECVQKYENAKSLLRSRGFGRASSNSGMSRTASADDDTVMVDSESLMDSAKAEVGKMLRSQIASAVAMNDKLKIVKLTSMLSALGYRDEACETYVFWICDHTIHHLKAMISRELRNMDDPSSAGMSHLTIVSNALDHVVAALEQEQQHVQETFGADGHLKLLHMLHSRCTQHCVPVVKDFLEKRRVFSLRNQSLGSKSSVDEQHKTIAPKAAAADPRRIDECLEDIAHLVSCCGLYMSYMEEEMNKAVEATQASQGAVSVRRAQSQHAALTSRDNALFDTIQELLSIFIPLQSEYFEAAFSQAVKLQEEALSKHAHHTGRSESATHNSVNTPTTFMGALTSLYSGDTGDGSTAIGGDTHDLGELSLVDDVFYFVRIAIHRAAGTKSTSILSAVIISAIEIIQTKLVTEVGHHVAAQIRKAGPSSSSSASQSQLDNQSQFHMHATIPAKALRWLCAAKQCSTYTTKIGEELHNLVLHNFTHPEELVRFNEQRHDIDLLAKSVEDKIRDWSQRIASLICQNWMHRVADKFLTTAYVIDEQQFYHNDLADPWAMAATLGWGHSLDFVDQCVTEETVRDGIVHDLCLRVVKTFEDLIFSKKQFSAFGALQLDKDIRCVRQFFMNRTEKPVRELFTRLTAMTSILLVDRPQEAAGLYGPLDGAPAVLTLEEKRRVLSLRVEFDPVSISQVAA